jgi:ubiquinone/menaquinone biosynthesis C-methylase UbiE
VSSPTRKRENQEHVDRVRRFYDRESTRYEAQRYGVADPRVSRPYLERLGLIFEMFDLPSGVVLDLGCGPGVLESHLLDRGYRVFATDLSEKMIEKARNAVSDHPRRDDASFFVASAESLPLRDGEFDAVLCIGVLAYWPDPQKTLDEIARVLRRGGILIIQSSSSLAPREWEETLLRRPYLRLRSILSGHDVRDADFPLRTTMPGRLEATLSAVGLDPVARRHYDFQLPLVGRVAPRLSERVAASMLRFSGSRLMGHFGRGFLIKAVRR